MAACSNRERLLLVMYATNVEVQGVIERLPMAVVMFSTTSTLTSQQCGVL